MLQKISAGKFHFEPPSNFTSFDHLVGLGEHILRNIKPEQLRGPEIDHQLEAGRLHDRELGRLFALQDAAGIDTSLTMGAVRFIP
jgi:hypothetical protein